MSDVQQNDVLGYGAVPPDIDPQAYWTRVVRRQDRPVDVRKTTALSTWDRLRIPNMVRKCGLSIICCFNSR